MAKWPHEKAVDILDFNFESDLMNGKPAMGKFMRLCTTKEYLQPCEEAVAILGSNFEADPMDGMTAMGNFLRDCV